MAPILKPTDATQLQDAIRAALAEGRGLEVQAGGSKRGFGPPAGEASLLDVSGLTGILDHDLDGRRVTLRPGTLLEELEVELLKHRRRLAFEPADWGPLLGAEPGLATVGGIIAANASGPRRLSHGALREHLLDAKAVSDQGLPVEGAELARSLPGSWGTRAVMHEVTLGVADYPEEIRTLLVKGLDDGPAMEALAAALGACQDITGAAHLPASVADCSAVPTVFQARSAITALRVEGDEPAVASRCLELTARLLAWGEVIPLSGHFSHQFWREVRDVMPFVGDDRIVWRLALPAAAAAATVAAIAAQAPLEALYDRAGRLAWLALDGQEAHAAAITQAARAAGGRATLFRAPADARAEVFALSDGTAGCLNRHRLALRS